jgi:hypothetical protein
LSFLPKVTKAQAERDAVFLGDFSCHLVQTASFTSFRVHQKIYAVIAASSPVDLFIPAVHTYDGRCVAKERNFLTQVANAMRDNFYS